MAKYRRLKFKRKNLLKGMIPEKPGIYKFYNKNGKLLYVGHTRKLRHRLQSYLQKDSFKAHPTKKALRPKIDRFYYNVMPEKKARRLEKNGKSKAKYNMW